ncbi:helix-turn-helix domain-containing protein [Actinophytocola sp.]|uniref:AraC family transcriptional regulator n=1 Tax=Actinophytocola sp. TaxID=1872138 RepID=UPI0038998CA8
MTGEVRLWRPADRVLMLAGRTSRYAVEPRGEYVFGVVAARPMRAARGGQRHVVQPGQLVAWDPSAAHSGESDEPWSARLMVVEADVLGNVAFPAPVLTDPALARAFVRMHELLERPDTTRLERDGALATWLHAVVDRHAGTPTSTAAGSDTGLRLACDYLAEHAERAISLDELAAVAGMGKFRLVKLFRDRTGLPPHALQIAHRVRRARRLLEAGHPAAEAAALTGFTDQSHLHRHFRRALGFTPGQYQRLLAGAPGPSGT